MFKNSKDALRSFIEGDREREFEHSPSVGGDLTSPSNYGVWALVQKRFQWFLNSAIAERNSLRFLWR